MIEPVKLYCPECRSVQLTFPTEDVTLQSLRVCAACEMDFVRDWAEIVPREDV